MALSGGAADARGCLIEHRGREEPYIVELSYEQHYEQSSLVRMYGSVRYTCGSLLTGL